MDFFKRFSELIENKGVTIYEISSKTGISESTLGKLAKGETKKPNQKNAEILAKYFNISIDWLKTGVGEKGVFVDSNFCTEQKSENNIGVSNISGNGHRIKNETSADINLEAVLKEMAEQRKTHAAQIDKFLAQLEAKDKIIEKLMDK